MTSTIQKYKYCEQVRANNLDFLTKVRNENMALKEEATKIISGLKGKLKWSEESPLSMGTKAAKQENRIDGVNALLQNFERDVCRAKNELGTESNHCIQAENDLKMAIEDATRKVVANTLEWVCLEAEEERERLDMMEEALRWPKPGTWPRMLLGLLRPTAFGKGLKIFGTS